MPSEYLATGTTAAASSETVVVDGASISLMLKGYTDSRARIAIEMKRADGNFVEIGVLTPAMGARAQAIVAPGTFRVRRPATTYQCGVDLG